MWAVYSAFLMAVGVVGAKRLLAAGSFALAAAYLYVALTVHNAAKIPSEGNDEAVAFLVVGIGWLAAAIPIALAWFFFGLNRVVAGSLKRRRDLQETE